MGAEQAEGGGRSEVKRSRAGPSHGEPRTEPPPRQRSETGARSMPFPGDPSASQGPRITCCRSHSGTGEFPDSNHEVMNAGGGSRQGAQGDNGLRHPLLDPRGEYIPDPGEAPDGQKVDNG